MKAFQAVKVGFWPRLYKNVNRCDAIIDQIPQLAKTSLGRRLPFGGNPIELSAELLNSYNSFKPSNG